MTHDDIPRYWHKAMGRSVYRNVPADLAPELHQRWMEREIIRKKASIAQTVVYYLRMPLGSGRSGLVKIEHTRNMQSKLMDLDGRYGGGQPDVLATEPGDQALEDQRHSQFIHLSNGGRNEYFRPEPELLGFIEQVRRFWGEPMITRSIPVDWPWPL